MNRSKEDGVHTTPLSDKLCDVVATITARPVNLAAEGDVPLRDLGLSSLRMIELISELEATFQIRVGDDDVDEDNFGTLSGLIRFMEGRTST